MEDDAVLQVIFHLFAERDPTLYREKYESSKPEHSLDLFCRLVEFRLICKKFAQLKPLQCLKLELAFVVVLGWQNCSKFIKK